VIRRTFGAHTPIQRCQIHKARNVTERLPKPLHASVRRALRQAWELDDADKAERLLRNLARRLEQQAPGVAASLLEGLDEMLTVARLKLPTPLRRSLACTNAIENIMGGSVQNLSHFRLAERHPALAHAVMAPLICWSFSNSMCRYRLVDHAVPAMWRSLAAARLSAD